MSNILSSNSFVKYFRPSLYDILRDRSISLQGETSTLNDLFGKFLSVDAVEERKDQIFLQHLLV